MGKTESKSLYVKAIYTLGSKEISSGDIFCNKDHVHGQKPTPKKINEAKDALEAEVQKYCKKQKPPLAEPTDVRTNCRIEEFTRK